jgi:hypothetical protein
MDPLPGRSLFMSVLRAALLVALVVAAAAAAGCGEDRGFGAAEDPDARVHAPVQRSTRPPADRATCRRLSRRLPGRRLARAAAMARKARCALRVVIRDGRDLPVTEDFSRSRVNVAVTSATVVRVVGLF